MELILGVGFLIFIAVVVYIAFHAGLDGEGVFGVLVMMLFYGTIAYVIVGALIMTYPILAVFAGLILLCGVYVIVGTFVKDAKEQKKYNEAHGIVKKRFSFKDLPKKAKNTIIILAVLAVAAVGGYIAFRGYQEAKWNNSVSESARAAFT